MAVAMIIVIKAVLSFYRLGQLFEYFAESDSEQKQKESQGSLR